MHRAYPTFISFSQSAAQSPVSQISPSPMLELFHRINHGFGSSIGTIASILLQSPVADVRWANLCPKSTTNGDTSTPKIPKSSCIRESPYMKVQLPRGDCGDSKGERIEIYYTCENCSHPMSSHAGYGLGASSQPPASPPFAA